MDAALTYRGGPARRIRNFHTPSYLLYLANSLS